MTTDRDKIKRSLIVVLACVVLAVVLGVANAAYVNHVHRQSEQRWCDLLGTYVTAYRDTPPSTELGREVAIKIEALWYEFGCA